MQLVKIQKIHFVGIGGIGVSAVAKMFARIGKEVSGSDILKSEIIEDVIKSGIKVLIGHKEGNLPKDTDLLVYSDAVPRNNPERKKARELKISEMSYFELLGELSREKFTIAISGTHGKSTTTALTGLMLAAGGLDPIVIVGSKSKAFKGGNLRHGRTKYFVVEACEHEAHMLNLRPKIIILTNIEEDHLDFYGSIESIKEAFLKYINLLPEDGLLVVNNDDSIIREILDNKKQGVKIISYGIENNADIRAVNLRIQDIQSEENPNESERCQRFEIVRGLDNLGEFFIKVPGKFNVYNGLAAASCALHFGIPLQKIKTVLKKFEGIWRRFEKIAEKDGIIVISDYAHHPTEIRETLKAVHDFYPGRRVVLAFQPHQHSRTQKLFTGFTESFDDADILILNEIFDVVGRENENGKISSKDLMEKIKERDEKRNIQRKIEYGKKTEDTKKIIKENIKQGDIVVIMGAGDIYKIAKEII